MRGILWVGGVVWLSYKVTADVRVLWCIFNFALESGEKFRQQLVKYLIGQVSREPPARGKIKQAVRLSAEINPPL
jgi:hypothetical protein